MSRRHAFIPDTQLKKGVPTNHIIAAAHAMVEYKPDVIVIAGDWNDMASLNSHAQPGSLELEGTRIKDDVEFGNEVFAKFDAVIQKEINRLKKNKAKYWRPELHFLEGNHEERLDRIAARDARFEGLIGSELINTLGWQRHKFLEIVDIDGISYSHYFSNIGSGKPIGGSIPNRLNKIGRSFTQGHVQGFLYATVPYPGKLTRPGLVAGSFYQHTMSYRGPQGADEWRGIVIKNQVKDGDYDIMPLRMDYILKEFG